MDFLIATQKAQRAAAEVDGADEILLYSHWDTRIFEVFLKAHAHDQAHRLRIRSNGFGSLMADLKALGGRNDIPPGIPLLVLIDEEVLLPGFALRSDAVLSRDAIDHSLENFDRSLQDLLSTLEEIASRRAIWIQASPLPAYPLYHAPPGLDTPISRVRHLLRTSLCDLHTRAPQKVQILDSDSLLEEFPLRALRDDRLLFSGGWPFSLEATSRMAEIITQIFFQKPAARKLLVTDADDTLWRGIVGEDGVEGISWTQEPLTYRHFIYQRTLNLLMSEGILVALATRNLKATLDNALARKDLILKKDHLVACRASWSAKSEMLAEILRQVNLLPSAAVFVDNSDFETGEIQRAFPETKCLLFPGDNGGLRGFLGDLRSCFDTRLVTREDRTRSKSIQQAIAFEEGRAASSTLEDYLQSMEMRARIEPLELARSQRAFQLLNKTNQFNLSGRRFEWSEWETLLGSRQNRAYELHFSDRHHDHGIVSVLLLRDGGEISDWVMSCRVFGRTIEHFFLNQLLRRFKQGGGNQLQLLFASTSRNGAIRSFLESLPSHRGKACGSKEIVPVEDLLPTYILPQD